MTRFRTAQDALIHGNGWVLAQRVVSIFGIPALLGGLVYIGDNMLGARDAFRDLQHDVRELGKRVDQNDKLSQDRDAALREELADTKKSQAMLWSRFYEHVSQGHR